MNQIGSGCGSYKRASTFHGLSRLPGPPGDNMVKRISPKTRQLQSQEKSARRQNRSCAPTPPSGPLRPVPQNPVFWLLALLATGSGWVAIQQGLVGTLAVFLAALVSLMLKHNDW